MDGFCVKFVGDYATSLYNVFFFAKRHVNYIIDNYMHHLTAKWHQLEMAQQGDYPAYMSSRGNWILASNLVSTYWLKSERMRQGPTWLGRHLKTLLYQSPLPSSWPPKVTFWGREHNRAKGICSGVTADPTSGMLFSLRNLISPQGSAQGCRFYETFLEDASPPATAPQTPVSSGHNLALNYFLSFIALFPRFQRPL